MWARGPKTQHLDSEHVDRCPTRRWTWIGLSGWKSFKEDEGVTGQNRGLRVSLCFTQTAEVFRRFSLWDKRLALLALTGCFTWTFLTSHFSSFSSQMNGAVLLRFSSCLETTVMVDKLVLAVSGDKTHPPPPPHSSESDQVEKLFSSFFFYMFFFPHCFFPTKAPRKAAACRCGIIATHFSFRKHALPTLRASCELYILSLRVNSTIQQSGKRLIQLCPLDKHFIWSRYLYIQPFHPAASPWPPLSGKQVSHHRGAPNEFQWITTEIITSLCGCPWVCERLSLKSTACWGYAEWASQ